MIKKVLFMRFPEGRAKALTFSYDDDVKENARLVEILNQHHMKGTFNLNSGLYLPEEEDPLAHRRMTKQAITDLFTDSPHEVAIHSYSHPFLETLPTSIASYEIMLDRNELEKQFHTIVRGMAYPFGTFSDKLISVAQNCGIAYARTVQSTEKFDIPTDWLRMPATCHHNNPRLMDLAKQFVKKKVSHHPILFYLWGHSYEFEDNNNWDIIENFTDYMGNRENDIWYATNIEIYDYISDYEHLIWSADAGIVKNPTARTLWFSFNDTIYSIEAGQTLFFEE